MKKLFGNINMTWKKLIIFAIATGIYTAIMALLPITKETSFRDIAIQFEWWILFGIIIIVNSRSPKDSALKCFVFFLISQPLVYLIQVPFSDMGWSLFKYYRYWFIWTLLTLPMGYIGYYIKKKNIISMVILLPMLILMGYLGVGYLTSMIESFPHHSLSMIFCFIVPIIIILSIFDKVKYKIVSIIIFILSVVGLIIFSGISSKYETYRTLDEYNIILEENAYISSFSVRGSSYGNTELIEGDTYTVKLSGDYRGKYAFTITDDINEYDFEYHYDKKEKTVVLNKKG